MTIRDWKEILAKYPDDMPVCIKTFIGCEDCSTIPNDLDVEDVSISKHLSVDKTFTYETLDIIMG